MFILKDHETMKTHLKSIQIIAVMLMISLMSILSSCAGDNAREYTLEET